jgi:hypothetical protein
MARKPISKLLASTALVGSEITIISQLSTSVRVSLATISALAVDNSYNDSGNNFIIAGFAVDDYVRVEGFTGNVVNNIFSGKVTALTAGKMTIGGADGDVIVDDAAGETVVITKWESHRIPLTDHTHHNLYYTKPEVDALITAGSIPDGDKGDITVSSGGAVWAVDPGAITLAKMDNVGTATVFYRKTAGSGAPEVQTLATLKTDLGLTGTNSGDQTSIVGITGSLAEFNAALTGADFATGGGTATGTNTGDQTTITGNAGTATALQSSRNFSITGGGITAAAVGFNGTANVALSASVDAGHITLARMANVNSGTVFYRKTASAGAPEVQTLATLKTDLGLTGTNSGDQTISLTGHVTGSGTGSFSTTISAGVVTLAMQANMATASVVYRKTAGAGPPEVQTLATLKTDLGLTGTNSGDQTITLTGPVTGSGTGSFATTITANAVGLTHLADIATASLLGRVTAATGDPEVLTGTQATTLLDAFTSGLKGLVPASGGGTTNFLRADGTWAAPPAGGSPTWGSITGTLSSQSDLQGELDAKADLAGGNTFTGTQNFSDAVNFNNPNVFHFGTNPGVYLRGDSSSFTPGLRIWHQNQTLDADALEITPYNGGGGTAVCRIRTPAAGALRYYADTTQLLDIDTTDAVFSVPVVVPDEAYGAGWNGDLSVPTKNAVYDKIETMGGGSTPTGTGFRHITAGVEDAASKLVDTADINDAQVTLAKMADMATASVIYRKTAGTGVPEVQTLATLKTDLGLTGTNSGDQTITLTGDVTGSGTGSFAASIASSVNLPGTPTAATAAATTNTTQIATTAMVQSALAQSASRMIPVMAGAMVPTTTNGASGPTSLELATNDVMITTLDFDTTTAESAQFAIPMPESWNEGTVTFVPLWTAASGSGTVVWGLSGRAYGEGDPLDAAVGTQQTSTDTLTTANDLHIGPESAAITITGTPVAGDMVIFRIQRVVASDTLGVDAKLIGVRLYITTNARDDS